MSDSYKLLFARAEEDICLSSRMANRHGLIAGATGTGKTVSLKVLAEAFSSIECLFSLQILKVMLPAYAMQGAEIQKLMKE